MSVLVGGVVVYGLAWPLARYQDTGADRLRPLYVDRQQVAEALHAQAVARGGTVQGQSVFPEAGDQVARLLGDGTRVQVVRQEPDWCLLAADGDGHATGWRCYRDDEDPAESAGTEPAEAPASYLELDVG